MSQGTRETIQHWLDSHLDGGHDPDRLLQAMLDHGWQAERARAALAACLAARRATAAGPVFPRLRLDDGATRLCLPDRDVAVLMHCQRPRAALLGGFLSEPECDQLIALAEARMARSPTLDLATGRDEITPVRSSEGMFFARAEQPVIATIEARIAALLNWPVEYGEGLQILRYRDGGEYRPHYDYFDPARPGSATALARGGQRVATLVMYLNSPGKGGETVFPDAGLTISALRGNALYFGYDQASPDSATLHGSQPVTEGEKWAAVKWLREKPFDVASTPARPA